MFAVITHRVIITALFLISGGDTEKSIKTNNILVAPGVGADSIILGQNADEILTLKGYPDRVSELKTPGELFGNIFKTRSSQKIFFDKIYYFKIKRLIVFLKNDLVSAIIGLSNSRITDDSINLAKGVDYFLFNYGNKYLNIITNGDNKIYLYSILGIAIVDDRSDDVIDMYIVFSKAKQNAR